MTGRFWLYLLVSSLFVSILMALAALIKRYKFAGLFWQTCLPGDGFFQLSFLGKLIAISILNFLLWGWSVMPAIYSSEVASNRFDSLLNSATVRDLASGLVVTGSVLRSTDKFMAGDIYFCSGARGNNVCPKKKNGKIFVLTINA